MSKFGPRDFKHVLSLFKVKKTFVNSAAQAAEPADKEWVEWVLAVYGALVRRMEDSELKRSYTLADPHGSDGRAERQHYTAKLQPFIDGVRPLAENLFQKSARCVARRVAQSGVCAYKHVVVSLFLYGPKARTGKILRRYRQILILPQRQCAQPLCDGHTDKKSTAVAQTTWQADGRRLVCPTCYFAPSSGRLRSFPMPIVHSARDLAKCLGPR